MTSNPMPWLVLAGIVLASLAWKGYIKLPSSASKSPPPGPDAEPGPPPATAAPHAIASMTSHELGILMALAARREAEAHIAERIARDAAEKLKATFTAPFSPAAPEATEPKAGG